MAQTDTVTLDGTIEDGDVYRVTIDGDVVAVTVGTDTAAASTGITIADVRTALVNAINDAANGVTDSVVASAGSGDGAITLTAAMPGIGFTATASATNNGANDDQSATASTVTGNLGGATQVAQLDTVTLQGTVQTGDTYSVTVNGTVVSLTIPTDNSITTLTQVRDALITLINDSAAGDAVTAAAGDTDETLAITADVAGVAFTATATATDGGGNTDNAAQAVTTTANLRGADDLAAQAATDAQTAATTAESEAAKADTAAKTAAASIAAKDANDDAVGAAGDAATQATTAKTAAADAALYARTAKAVGDAVGEALNSDTPDLLEAIEAQLETAQVTRVTLSGTVEAGDVFTITVGSAQATFTVSDQADLTAVRDAFIQKIISEGSFGGLVTVEAGATAESIRLTAVTPGADFTTTATAVNGSNLVNDQAARVQRQVEADQVTQQDTITVDGDTEVAEGGSFSIRIGTTTVTVFEGGGGTLSIGDGPAEIAAALIAAINTSAAAGTVTAAAGAATGALTLTATQTGALGAFLTVVPDGDADTLSLDAISNGSVADRAAQLASDASDAAQAALTAANAASDAADDAQTAAQAAANQDGAGSVAQAYLANTQSQVTATNSSVASAVRDAAAAAQSAASAQAQADLAGADVGAIAAAITAANTAAIQAADEDADTAAEAAEASFTQATANATTALQQALNAITDARELIDLSLSFDQVTLTGTASIGDTFTLSIDPLAYDEEVSAVDITITVGDDTDGSTDLNDIRDALVSAVNSAATTNGNGLFGAIQASTSAGDGRFVIASSPSGTPIEITTTVSDEVNTGAESASSALISSTVWARVAQRDLEDLLEANELPANAGSQTSDQFDIVISRLNAAIDATRQEVSISLSGTYEAGDIVTINYGAGSVVIHVGDDTGGSTALADIRDLIIDLIGNSQGMTAAAGFQDNELLLIANDPAAARISVTASVTNNDSDSSTPVIKASGTGTEAALRALVNGLTQASAVADTIQAAVDTAGTAAETARAAADGLAPAFDTNDALTAESAATIVTTANTLGSLSPALDPSVPADVVTAAQLLAEIAEGYVPDALSGAATANAQATIAQQAAFQAASGLAQFEQAIIKARNEAELRIQQEARDSAPVAGDDVIGDGDATNGGPVSGDDEVLEDQAITFDVLGNDKRADGGDLTNAAIAAVGQPAHGKITIVPEVRELNFGPAFTDGDQITLTINGTSVTYTLTSLEGLNAEGNAALFVDLINGTPAMAAVVSAVSAGRGGAITLTSAVPGTPIVTSVATQGDVTADADTITVPNGRVTYTPDANYNGTDTFTYTVSNGANPPSFDTATVTIDITPTNDNPDAKNDFITTADDSTAISKTAAAGLLANDTDIDTGDSLSIIKVNGSTVGVAQNVNFTLPNGDPVVAQVTINADGSYTVNPNGQFEPLAAGQSATGTLTYTVSDGHAGTDDQTISLANTVANDTGVNQVSTYTVDGTVERGDVFEITVNGTRISHTVTDESTVNAVRDALITKLNANGAIAGKVTASAGGGGEVVITANLAGQAFTTSAQAINAGTDVATLTVTITGSNDAPTADADTASGDEDTTITGTLTATDPDLGDTLTFAVAGGGQAANGTVTIQSNGDFSYVPNAEFSGTDSFTFRVTDAAGIASTATVTITVNNVNDDPVITAGGDPAPTFAEGGDAVVIDGNIEIADVDTANFNTGYLRAQVTDNLDPGDHLLIQEAGGITLSGADVLFNGVVIGTIDGTDDGSAANLLITLDADATPAAVQALARTIAFTNDAAEPTTVARTVTFTVDSGDGGTTTQDATVQVALESGLTRSDHNQLNFSGDWFDAANWTSGLPDETTIAVINDGGYAPITFNNGPVNETVGQLVVNADLNILAGTLNVLEPSSIEQDATVTVSNASVLGTGDLNIAGTVALSGGATLGLPLITLDAAENGGIHGEISVTGSGNQIAGALAIEYLGGYFGTLALGEAGSGNVALDVALGIVNDGDIIIDNSDAAPADTVLTVGGPGIVNSRNIIFSDTSGGGGQRIIEGSIDTANGTITVDANATIDLAGGILNAAAGTIELATATVLTVSDGQTIVDGDTYLSGTGALDLAGTGSLTLTSNFALNSGDPELTLSGAITIDGVGAPTLTIGDGRNLTLDGDTVSDTVNLAVDGTLTIEGTGTVIAAPTVINSPNGAFTVAPGATVTITAPGFLSNNGGEISVGAGATLILDGVNLENAGVITGEGMIQLANGADIAGDGIIEVAGVDNIGTLDITGGPLNLDPGASVNIDVTDNVTHDVLHLDTMDLTAAGDTLNLTFAPDFDPTTDGNSFQVLTYSGHTAEIGGDGAVLEAGIDNIFDTIQHNLGPEYTVTIDYGSTAATVTVNRNPEIAVVTNGQGMQFDGVDDRILIPVDGTVNQLTSITVEAVITLTEYPTGGARIAQNFGAGYEGWSFTVSDDGSLYVEVGAGGGSGQLSSFTSPASVLIPGDPAHVAFSYDAASGDIAIYVNGVDVGGTVGGIDPVNNLGATTADVSIGYPFPFDGVMDEFRIYDHARTATEVAADAGGDTATGIAPLVHYDFADGTATNLGSLGSASDGILDNGLGGAALAFDGSDDFVQGDTAGIDFGNAFSIEFVVQTEMATTGYIMTIGDTFSGGVTANNLLFANIPSAAGNLRIGQYGVIDINSTTLVNDGVPHHVSLTHDGAGNYKLYIDGVLEQSPPTTSVPNITGSTLVLGDAIASQPAFDGAIGDFRIYSDERNATEIAADATGAVDTDNLQIHYDIDATDVADGTITNQGALGSSADATVGTITGVDAADPAVIDIVNPVAPLAVPLVGQALSFDGTVSVDAVDASVIDFTASGGNTLQFFAATDEIVAGQVGTFANLVAGQTITVSGSMTANDATFTIADVSADGTTITVQETGSIVGTTALASGANIVSETTSPLATGTGAFTYEAWFRTDDPANPQTIIRVGDPAGDYAQIRVTGDGRVQALAPDAGQTTLESSLGTNDGLWHHVAYSHDGAGNLELFLDGVSVATTTAAINSIDAGSVTIGGWQTANQPFFGEIFDVRAYDVARSQADILLDMNQLPTGAEPNLTGAWHLDDVLNGTTDQFRDVTGNGGTGTYSGGTPVFADNNLFTMAEDSVLHGQITGTDVDDVNDTEDFTFGVAAQGANGTVTVNPTDGTWEYTPNTDFFGTDSFEVQVTDSGGATATKTVSVSVLNVNDAPSVETVSGAATFAEDGTPVVIDPALTITDLDSADFDGGSLTIEISGGYQTGDVLAIDAGAAFDLSSGMTNGSLISIGQDVIGVINLDGATGTLSIDLTGFATPGVVEQLARAVTFQNDTEEPGAGARGIDFTLTDGDGGTSAALSQSVNITPVNDAPEVTTATLPAGTATFDAEVLVNTALTGEQSAADVTYFAGGTKFVATWNNYSVGGGADLGTIGRIFNADGTPDGPEFVIANTAPGSEYNARVSPMTDGGFIVSYVNQPTAADATTSDLYVQRYDSTGQAVSRDGATPGADAFNVGEYFSGTVQNGGTVVGLSNGGFVIAIDQQDSGIASGQDVTARVFGANGLPVTGEFLLGASDVPATQGTELAALPGGGFVAVWTDNTDGDNDLFARVYDNSGTPLGAEFAVAVNQGGGTQQDQHEVATLSNGNFAVAWRTDDIASGDNDGNGGIGLRIFGPDGTPVTGDLLANTDITGHQNEPSIAALPDGGFVVSWSTNDVAIDGDGTAIRAQRFDAAGAKVGTEFTINENTAGNQQQSAIAADGDGNLIAVFRQSDPVGATADNTEIGARVISFGLDGKTYVEDGAPLVVDSGITLTDVDSATLDGATVTITTAFEANTDILSFSPVGAIGGSYDAATGALTLTGTGTVAEYEQVLRSVSFNSTAVQPDLADRTIEFQVTDDQGAPSTPFAVTIGVENINDVPEISSAGGNATFTEDGPAVAIDTAIDIIDIDSTDFDLGQFTAAITAGGTAGDVLDIDTSGNIGLSAGLTPASVVSVSGTDIGLVNAASTAGNIIIDLDPDATPALVQELARAVTYQNISEEPGVAQRTVTFQVSDGDGGVSAAFDRTVDISPVNDAPEILGVVQSSNAAQFDGIGDSISLANPVGLPNGAADFTWSAWVKTDATAVNHAILSVGNATGTGTNGQLFIQGSGQLAFDSLNVDFITGGPAINDDAWHHVAVTTSGGYSEIFVDGVSVSAPVDLSLVIGTDSAFIGQAPDGTNQFQGEISDVRIYDVARTVDDIAADMSLRLTGGEPNLVAYYPLDNDDGGFVADLAGGDNIGTLLGDVTIGGASPDFLVGAGASFTDSFDDGSLSTDYTVDTTNAGAAATEGSGVLSLSSRAIVSTAVEYTPTATTPITIETSLQFNDTNDFMAIATRSDGIADPGNYNFITNGVYATFGNAGGVNQMAIYRVVGGTVTPIVDTGSGAFTFNNGTIYDVVVTDDGLNLSITVTEQNNPSNTLTLTGQDSTEFTDNHISFLNRENVANGPQIDSLEISQPSGLLVVPEDGSLSSQIVAGDLDNAPGDLNFTLDAGAAHGTVDVQPDGTFTYTPNPDYTGGDSFTVTVDDGAGGTNTRTILLDVQNTNDAPAILGAQANVNTPQFDGIDDFVQVLNPAALLPAGNAPFTIEAWVQPAAAGTLASLGTDTGNQGLEIFVTESGELGVGTDDRTTIEVVDTGNAIDDGAWHHVAVAYDGTTFRLYVDGAETASGVGALNFAGGEFTFGKGFNDSEYFKGSIDDIRIWADERTAQEIADNHQQADLADTTDLAARYTLDNMDAADIDPALIDVSGNGHAISSGGPPSDPFGAYAVLDGTGDMVNVTQINPVDATNKITIAAWIKPDDLTGTQAITAIGAGGTAMVFALDGNGLSFTNANVTGTAAAGNLAAGVWNHVAVTYDGDTGAFETFVNGVSQGGGNVGANPLPAATTMAIGSSNGDGSETPENSFAGAIAQVRMFDEVRQPADVQADMAQSHYDGQAPATLINELSLDGYENDGGLVGDAHILDQSPTLLGPNVMSGAVTFDGVDDVINFGQEMAFEVDTTFTLEAWINPKSSSNWSGIVGNVVDDGANESGYGLHLTTGEVVRFAFTIDGVIQIIDTNAGAVSLNEWSHVAATYDGQTARVFVNGEEVASQAVSGTAMTFGFPNDLRIGAYHDINEDYFFDGEIADVRIWDVARTGWEIENGAEQPIPAESSGLVFNVALNEGAGGDPVSSISDAVNYIGGIPYGGPVYTDTGPEIYHGLDIAAPLIGTEDTVLRGRISAEDIDGDALTFTMYVDPTNGTVTLNPDGSYEYTPDLDYFGTDSFQVTVSDGFGGTDTRTVYLDVAPVTDVFIGGSGDDTLEGTIGDDILDGGTGENILIGGEYGGGDDYLTGGTRGKAGVDRNIADYFGAGSGITVDASTDTVTGAATGTDTLGNIDQIIGSGFDDIFDMTGWDNSQFDAFDPDGSGGTYTPTVGVFNVVRGGGGDDTITGNGFTRVDYDDAYGGVTATLTGATNGSGYGHLTGNNAGSDGGAGGAAALGLADDTGLDTFVSGVNELAGSNHNDILTGNDNNNVLIGRGGNDTLDGGGGGLDIDRADYRSAGGGINVDFTGGADYSGTVSVDGDGGSDTLIDIEQVRGSQFDDTFIGDGGDNRFRGEGGADTLTGGGGNDRFEYTRGDESVDVAYDTITDFNQGGGADTIRFNGMDGLELMTVEYDHAGPVQATVDAIAIDDGVQDRVVFFTDDTDGYLYVKGRGTGTTDYDGTLIKLEGVTTPLAGTDVRDGNGNALIETTGGTDTIAALSGQQTHTGGAGPDYFVFTAETDSGVGSGNRDAITDFVAGVDKIVLEGLVADGVEFVYQGLSLLNSGGDATAGFGLVGLSDVLQIDLDGNFIAIGNLNADMQINLVDYTGTLDTDDFIIITTSTGTDIDDAYSGRTGNDWILASTTSTFATDIASAAVTTGDTITLAGGSDGIDTLIIRDPMEFIGAEWSGSDLMLFYEDIGSGYVHKTTVTNHAANSLDYIEFEFKDDDALDRFAVANGSDASAGAVNTLVVGGSGIDTLTGSAHDDILLGNDGDDNLFGSDGDDLLIGGAGEDTLDGGAGDDTVSYFQNPTDGVIVNLSNGTEDISPYSIDGGTAHDVYSGEIDTLSNIENAEGSSFDDFLIGSDGTNRLSGDDGNDTIYGGGGADVLEGGEGMDVFIYNSPSDSGLGGLLRDVILDFDAVGADKIDISAFSQGMFTFVGDDTNDFAGFGDSSARFNNETKILEIDADGDAQADMEIELQNVDGGDLSTSDFEVGGGQIS
ncbi:MAG: LamG-like jellyroll fold domain-containing protein [Alphaproteobacteria bacterium]